jgi:hypothetical protein
VSKDTTQAALMPHGTTEAYLSGRRSQDVTTQARSHAAAREHTTRGGRAKETDTSLSHVAARGRAM